MDILAEVWSNLSREAAAKAFPDGSRVRSINVFGATVTGTVHSTTDTVAWVTWDEGNKEAFPILKTRLTAI